MITHATLQSYMDVAWLTGALYLLVVPAALSLKKNDPAATHVSVEWS